LACICMKMAVSSNSGSTHTSRVHGPCSRAPVHTLREHEHGPSTRTVNTASVYVLGLGPEEKVCAAHLLKLSTGRLQNVYNARSWHSLSAAYLSNVFYRASYASAVLEVVILSVRPSHACFVTNPNSKEPTGDIFFISHERAIILVFCCERSQRNSNGVTPNGGAKERWGRLKRRFSTNIWLYLTNGALSVST